MTAPTDGISDADLSKIIRGILSTLSADERVATLSDSTDLFDAGIIDSYGVLQLIAALEAALGVNIPERDLIPQNLWSLAAIRHLIKRLSSPAA